MRTVALLLVAVAAASARAQAPVLPPGDRLTSVVNAYPSWSPDGRTIVYQSNAGGSFDLYMMNADGSNPRVFFASPRGDMTPVFSPDGRSVLFVSERDGSRDVFVIGVDGQGLRKLAGGPSADIHPVYSADGRRIMFSSNRERLHDDDYDIYVMNADGSNLTRLTQGPEVDTYASWSPDGSKIVTRRVIQDPVTKAWSNSEVFVLDADGANPRNLTQSPMYDGWPVWSPDGQWILYASGPDAGFPTRLMMVRPDGTDRRVVTDVTPDYPKLHDRQPAWSTDGRKIAFARYRPTFPESSEIYVMDAPR